MSRAFVVREGDPYDHGFDYLPSGRLLEVLEYVEVNEELPDLSNAELDDLVGEEKMIVECHHAHIRNTYQLTEYGKSQLTFEQRKNKLEDK